MFFHCIQVRDLYAQLELEHSKLLQQKRTNEELRVKEAVLKQRLEAVAEDYKISAWIEKRREEKCKRNLPTVPESSQLQKHL